MGEVRPTLGEAIFSLLCEDVLESFIFAAPSFACHQIAIGLAIAIVEYGTCSVSAMMKAAAPITGGISWPPIDAHASTPAANSGR